MLVVVFHAVQKLAALARSAVSLTMKLMVLNVLPSSMWGRIITRQL